MATQVKKSRTKKSKAAHNGPAKQRYDAQNRAKSNKLRRMRKTLIAQPANTALAECLYPLLTPAGMSAFEEETRVKAHARYSNEVRRWLRLSEQQGR